MIIPRIQVGSLIYSDTAARYVADLLGDVARTLVWMSGWLTDAATPGNPLYDSADDDSCELANVLVVDAPALLAGADYCLWLRDHVLHELATLCDGDRRAAELMVGARDADKAALYRMQQEPLPAAPPYDPPASLVPLGEIVERCRRYRPAEKMMSPQEITQRVAMGLPLSDEPTADIVAAGYARRLDQIRSSLAEARNALGHNHSGKTPALVSHVDALTRWLAPTAA